MSSRNAVVQFNYYLDRATDHKEAEANYFAVNKLCRMVDEAIIKPEDAIQAIHGKVVEEDPETVLHALKVLNAVFYKCGSLAHKVICTEFYMSLLKEIIQTTDNKNIKETILNMLQEWAENFKYFPQYSAPQKLLQELKDSEALKITNKCENKKTKGADQTSSKQTNGFPKSIKNTEKFDKNRLNETSVIKSNNESSNDKSDTDFQEKEEDFKKALRDYQQKRKLDYKNYRKTLGLPPLSSDEEDNDDIKKGSKNCQVKKEEACMQNKSSCGLTKELQQIKEQRCRLKSDIQQVRAFKHDDYVQSNNGAALEMKQCKDENCKDCKKFKSKEDTEEYCIPKRFPYEIRKVIESKQRMKQSFEEIKRMKQEAYYNNNNNNKPLSSLTNNHKKKDAHGVRDSESEDEQLQKAILESKREMTAKPVTAEPKQQKNAVKRTLSSAEIEEAKILEKVLAASRLDTGTSKIDSMAAERKRMNNAIKNTPSVEEMDEEKILEEAIALSQLDARTEETDENALLQQVINRSFAEEEEKNFSSMPEMSEDDLIDYIKQMSLSETHNSQTNNEERNSDKKDMCLICFDTKITMQFMPCNHKCICKECATGYNLPRCLLCQRFYEKIIDP